MMKKKKKSKCCGEGGCLSSGRRRRDDWSSELEYEKDYEKYGREYEREYAKLCELQRSLTPEERSKRSEGSKRSEATTTTMEPPSFSRRYSSFDNFEITEDRLEQELKKEKRVEEESDFDVELLEKLMREAEEAELLERVRKQEEEEKARKKREEMAWRKREEEEIARRKREELARRKREEEIARRKKEEEEQTEGWQTQHDLSWMSFTQQARGRGRGVSTTGDRIDRIQRADSERYGVYEARFDTSPSVSGRSTWSEVGDISGRRSMSFSGGWQNEWREVEILEEEEEQEEEVKLIRNRTRRGKELVRDDFDDGASSSASELIPDEWDSGRPTVYSFSPLHLGAGFQRRFQRRRKEFMSKIEQKFLKAAQVPKIKFYRRLHFAAMVVLGVLGVALMFIFFLLYLSFIARVRPPGECENERIILNFSATRIRLRGGRYVSFREQGVGADRAEHSVVVVHDLLSSRLAGIPGINESLLEEYKVRLICYDRPGYGQSDPHLGRNYNTSAYDIVEIADALNLGEKFWVVGFGGGGPHVWAAINYLPERLAGVALFAPAGNPYVNNMTKEEIDDTWGVLTLRQKWMHSIARRFPALLPTLLQRTAITNSPYVPRNVRLSLGQKVYSNHADSHSSHVDGHFTSNVDAEVKSKDSGFLPTARGSFMDVKDGSETIPSLRRQSFPPHQLQKAGTMQQENRITDGNPNRKTSDETDSSLNHVSVGSCKQDQEWMEQPAVMKAWQEDLKESLQQGCAFPMAEELMMLVNDWGFSLSELPFRERTAKTLFHHVVDLFVGKEKPKIYDAPIHIWQGTDDQLVPVTINNVAKRLVEQNELLDLETKSSPVKLHYLPGEGHFSWFWFCDECHRRIFQTLFRPDEASEASEATLSFSSKGFSVDDYESIVKALGGLKAKPDASSAEDGEGTAGKKADKSAKTSAREEESKKVLRNKKSEEAYSSQQKAEATQESKKGRFSRDAKEDTKEVHPMTCTATNEALGDQSVMYACPEDSMPVETKYTSENARNSNTGASTESNSVRKRDNSEISKNKTGNISTYLKGLKIRIKDTLVKRLARRR